MDVVSHIQQLFNFEPQNSFREMGKINILMFFVSTNNFELMLLFIFVICLW